MSLDIDHYIEPEQLKIIWRAIKDYLSNRKGIYNFLKKRGQVIDLADEIHFFDYFRNYEDDMIRILGFLAVHLMNEYGGLI